MWRVCGREKIISAIKTLDAKLFLINLSRMIMSTVSIMRRSASCFIQECVFRNSVDFRWRCCIGKTAFNHKVKRYNDIFRVQIPNISLISAVIVTVTTWKNPA